MSVKRIIAHRTGRASARKCVGNLLHILRNHFNFVTSDKAQGLGAETKKTFDYARSPRERRRALLRSALLCSILLAAEIYLLLYDIQPTSNYQTKSRPLIGSLKQSENEVRSRSAGTITWMVSKNGDELRREDAILTMNKSSAEVALLDGGELRVAADSMIILDKSSNEEKLLIRLVEGSFIKAGKTKKPIRLNFVGNQYIDIEDSSGQARFSMAKDTSKIKIEVLSGSLQIVDKDPTKTQTLSEMQRLELNDRGESHIEKIEPTIRLNSPPSEHIFSRDEEQKDFQAILSWQEDLDPKFSSQDSYIEIAKQNDFSEINLTKKIQNKERANATLQSEIDIKELSDDLYYWRIRAESGLQSDIRNFRIFTKTAPAISDTQQHIKVVANRLATLSWKLPIKTAIEIEFSNTESFEQISRRELITEDKKYFEVKFTSPQIVFWRVRADYGRAIGKSTFSNTGKIEIVPKPLLQAPKIRKLKIRLHSSSGPILFRTLHWLISGVLKTTNAHAAETKQKPVTLDLEWEPVKDATGYLLQVSETEDFANPILNKRLNKPQNLSQFAFSTFQTEQERTFYFRISSIDAEGTTGPFSEPQQIQLPALEKAIKKIEPEESSRRHRYGLIVAIGAAYHYRNFKKSTSNPESAVGKGIIPAFGEFEISKGVSDYTAVLIRANLLAETAEAETTNVLSTTMSIPLICAQAGIATEFWNGTAEILANASTTNSFSFSGRTLSSARTLIFGPAFSFGSSRLNKKHFYWKVHTAPLVFGALGIDGDLQLTYLLGEGRGLFFAADGFGRFSNKENAFGGIFKIGFKF